MKRLLLEVLLSVRMNRKRLLLTGLAVSWGMFILIVLLGASEGLKNGVVNTFHINMPKLSTVYPGVVSIPWHGLSKGNRIELFRNDAVLLENSGIEYIEEVFPVVNQPGQIVSNGKNPLVVLTGCPQGYSEAVFEKVVQGRDIDGPDVQHSRNVMVVNSYLAEQLAPSGHVVGTVVDFNGIPFTIVGVTQGLFAEDTSPMCFCPISTAMTLFRARGNVDALFIRSGKVPNMDINRKYVDQIRKFIADNKGFNPDDNMALQVANDNEYFILGYGVLDSLSIFIWLLGIGMLVAGIIGVSNIMTVSVKERTKEFGIRLTMGAPGSEIIKLVVTESLIIVFSFGYLGIMFALLLLKVFNSVAGGAIEMFSNPSVGFWTVIAANLVITAAGVIAGYRPAKRATEINLVEVLK